MFFHVNCKVPYFDCFIVLLYALCLLLTFIRPNENTKEIFQTSQKLRKKLLKIQVSFTELYLAEI